jgi:hypothetical protein
MAVEAPSLTSAPADQAHVPHQPMDSNSSNPGGNANGRKRPASPTGKESAVSGIDGAVEGVRRAGIMERSEELIRPFELFPFDASISSTVSPNSTHVRTSQAKRPKPSTSAPVQSSKRRNLVVSSDEDEDDDGAAGKNGNGNGSGDVHMKDAEDKVSFLIDENAKIHPERLTQTKLSPPTVLQPDRPSSSTYQSRRVRPRSYRQTLIRTWQGARPSSAWDPTCYRSGRGVFLGRRRDAALQKRKTYLEIVETGFNIETQ